MGYRTSRLGRRGGGVGSEPSFLVRAASTAAAIASLHHALSLGQRPACWSALIAARIRATVSVGMENDRVEPVRSSARPRGCAVARCLGVRAA
jgi:hypothetical protein